MGKTSKTFSLLTIIGMILAVLMIVVGILIHDELRDLSGLLFILSKAVFALFGIVPIIILLISAKKDKMKGEVFALIYTIVYGFIGFLSSTTLISLIIMGISQLLTGFMYDVICVQYFMTEASKPFSIFYGLLMVLAVIFLHIASISGIVSKKKRKKAQAQEN